VLCNCCNIAELKNRFFGLKNSTFPEMGFMGAEAWAATIVEGGKGGSSKLGHPSLFHSTQFTSRCKEKSYD
jgi:hypothetical protein